MARRGDQHIWIVQMTEAELEQFKSRMGAVADVVEMRGGVISEWINDS